MARLGLSLLLFLASWILPASTFAQSPMVITVQGKETALDTRFDYDHAVIRLALEKTEPTHGPFEIRQTPIGLNAMRSLAAAKSGVYQNYLVKFSAHDDLLGEVGIIPFPVDLGIVGYRIGFVSPNAKEQLASVRTEEELKQLEIIQGLGWLDTKILQFHGFNVLTGGEYNSMFKMVALNRTDWFLRGANELLGEWEARHPTLPSLIYDETVAVYYPLPRFLVTTRSNTELMKRVQAGLVMAYDDGSLIKLWEDKYLPSVTFAMLEKRKIFRFSNPFLARIDPSWEKYVYTPFRADRTDSSGSGGDKQDPALLID